MLTDLVQDGPALLATAVQCRALPMLQLASYAQDGPLINAITRRMTQHGVVRRWLIYTHSQTRSYRLIEHDCREHWFESLAYVTFANRAKLRTHIFNVYIYIIYIYILYNVYVCVCVCVGRG